MSGINASSLGSLAYMGIQASQASTLLGGVATTTAPSAPSYAGITSLDQSVQDSQALQTAPSSAGTYASVLAGQDATLLGSVSSPSLGVTYSPSSFAGITNLDQSVQDSQALTSPLATSSGSVLNLLT